MEPFLEQIINKYVQNISPAVFTPRKLDTYFRKIAIVSSPAAYRSVVHRPNLVFDGRTLYQMQNVSFAPRKYIKLIYWAGSTTPPDYFFRLMLVATRPTTFEKRI